MRILAFVAVAALALLPGCDRKVGLGAEVLSGTSAGGGCTGDGDCGAGKVCQAGACAMRGNGCARGRAPCAGQAGSVCAPSCPSCASGDSLCCTDNGFGSCQCFCAASCSEPPCAPAGADAGSVADPGCQSESDCLCGERCEGAVCQVSADLPACSGDSDCVLQGCTQTSCVAGMCVPPGWQCQDTRQCNGMGRVCLGGSCLCAARSGQACATSADCAGCNGEVCRSGTCSTIFSTSSAGASSGSSGGSGSSGSGGSLGGSIGGTGSVGSGGSVGSVGSVGATGGSN